VLPSPDWMTLCQLVGWMRTRPLLQWALIRFDYVLGLGGIMRSTNGLVRLLLKKCSKQWKGSASFR
jgi:hypothetical protein